jgi:tetratricopeptide (TPR) repeat protein
MTLRPALTLSALGFCALMTHGCAGDPPAHPRSADSIERGLDSVIRLCRGSLAAGSEGADVHTRLGEAILEKVALRARFFRNMVWLWPGSEPGMLRNIGHRIDRISTMSLLDTLREAQSHIAAAIALKPDNGAARRIMGRLYMALSRGMPIDSLYEKATASFDTSLALEPASAEGYFGLGCSLFRRNRSAQALVALNKSLSFDSTNGSAYLMLGEAYMDTGNITFAFACFENAARLGLTTAGEYIQLAEHYTDQQAERRLLGQFAYLRTGAPGLLKPTVRAGLRFLSLYHPAIAMDICSRALEADSSCAEAHLLKTRLYLQEGDTASALDEYMEAFSIGTAPFETYQWFPRELLELAYDRMPDNEILLYIIGQRSSYSGESARAIALFQKAVERKPESAVAAYLLGQAFAASRDTARAFEWFDRATALPQEALPSMYWSIQYSYVREGLIQKAVNVYQKYVIDTEQGWVKELLYKEHRPDRYRREKVLLAAAYCAVGYECSWEMSRGRPGNRKERAIEQFRKAAAMGSVDAVESLKKMGGGSDKDSLFPGPCLTRHVVFLPCIAFRYFEFRGRDGSAINFFHCAHAAVRFGLDGKTVDLPEPCTKGLFSPEDA